jgi:hypothetical protein
VTNGDNDAVTTATVDPAAATVAHVTPRHGDQREPPSRTVRDASPRQRVVRREPEETSYLELATLPSAPFWARRQTRTSLTAWQLPPDIIDTAELLVCELVTNAAKMSDPASSQSSGLAGTERVSLTLRLLPGRLVIEVFDHHPSPPVLTNPSTDAESGRGLLLVQALAKGCGAAIAVSGAGGNPGQRGRISRPGTGSAAGCGSGP